MNEIELARVAIALIGTAAAAYYDIYNKKNVPDRLLYAFLALSLAVNVFDPSQFIARLPVALLIIAFLYVTYRIGQLGGADVFILASIYSAIPVMQTPLMMQPQIPDFFGLPSIFPIFSMAVFIFSVTVIARYLPSAIVKTIRGKVKFNLSQIAQVIVLIVAYSFTAFLFLAEPIRFSLFHMLFIAFVMFLVVFFVLYKDLITLQMIRWKTGRRIETEDVIALEAIDPRIVSKHKLGRLVDEKQLRKMLKLKRKWPVLDLPMFLPYVLIALIAYILIGDPLLYPF
jgi:hypothetical protein